MGRNVADQIRRDLTACGIDARKIEEVIAEVRQKYSEAMGDGLGEKPAIDYLESLRNELGLWGLKPETVHEIMREARSHLAEAYEQEGAEAASKKLAPAKKFAKEMARAYKGGRRGFYVPGILLFVLCVVWSTPLIYNLPWHETFDMLLWQASIVAFLVGLRCKKPVFSQLLLSAVLASLIGAAVFSGDTIGLEPSSFIEKLCFEVRVPKAEVDVYCREFDKRSAIDALIAKKITEGRRYFTSANTARKVPPDLVSRIRDPILGQRYLVPGSLWSLYAGQDTSEHDAPWSEAVSAWASAETAIQGATGEQDVFRARSRYLTWMKGQSQVTQAMRDYPVVAIPIALICACGCILINMGWATSALFAALTRALRRLSLQRSNHAW
jgi:hypothetical protein